uniref:TRUD domain-containing protein n=1 Tax=Mesocestoides corti TaxID=53468 RepID=A0A5K3F1Z5_MESCO
MCEVDGLDVPSGVKRAKYEDPTDSYPNTISEFDVGISEFLLPNRIGFKGTLKGRWEDFLVREVDNSGNICTLSSIVPIDPSSGSSTPNMSESYIIPIEIDEVLKEIDCETMFEASFPASDDKSERENFHKAIRSSYPALVSKTVEIDNNRFIIVTRSSLTKGKKDWERSSRTHDPPKHKPYCHFVLYKEGKDTMQALHVIGRMLKINSNSFTYAGTKDKRAITTQNVSIKNVSSRRLASLNPRLNGIKLGNFKYSSEPIALGDLHGNRFSVVIRDVVADDSVIHKAVQEWQKHGFINYFGLQRFGHCNEARTYDIGKEIIKSSWEKAIDLILTPTTSDLPIVRQVKERYLKTQDAKACGDDIPQCLEKTLLLGIARHGKTLTALQVLPRNLRHLYAHSYQSLVWNKVASRRVRELGIDEDYKARVGDLYFPQCPSISKGLRSVDSSSELCYDDAFNESSKPEEFRPSKPPVTPAAPSRVTADGERPSIHQVVLPLPGYEVVFPDNECGKWYFELFDEDSLKLDDFKHKVKDFALPGSYRHLIVKPEDVHYEIHEYVDPKKPLIQSDYAAMCAESSSQSKPDEQQSPSPESEKFRALVLEFTLPKAAYATMAIRELMRDVTVVQ